MGLEESCLRVEGEFSESFAVEVGVRQGCVMSPWLFNIFMDGLPRMDEMMQRVGGSCIFRKIDLNSAYH